jgi:hypothetical protein
MKKRFAWLEILLMIVVMGISLYAALSDSQNLAWRWFTRDDAYYYFKVAQNISEGHGSTFDGINPTNGYHPLWMLICIPIFALARFDLVLPLRILLLVMGALSAGTAILFYRMIGRIFHPTIGAIAAIYWAFNYDILTRVYQQGLETGIAVFCVVLLAYKLFELERTWRTIPITNRQLLTLGFIALLTALSRLDLIFLVALMGVWIIFRTSPLRYFLPLDVAAILVSVPLAFITRLSVDEYYRFVDAAIMMVIASFVIKIPLAYFAGLYQPAVLSKATRLITRLAIFLVSSSVLITGVMLILVSVKHVEGFPRITIAYDLIFSLLYFGLSRFAALGLRNRQTTPVQQTSPWEYLQINWKQWLIEGSLYYGVMAVGLGIYLLINKFSFGTSSPVSGQIKRWWGSLPGQVYGGSVNTPLSFFGINYHTGSNTWYPVSTYLGNWAERSFILGPVDVQRYLTLLTIIGVIVYIFFFFNRQKAKSAIVQLSIIPLFASTWFQVLSYNALGYSAYKEWYWVVQNVVIVLAISVIPGLLSYFLRRNQIATITLWIITASFGIYMVVPFWSAIRGNMTYNEWKPTDPDNDIAAFLEAHTEPGSIIGMTGGGNAAYFIHDRTVINMDGLINSNQYFQLLKQKAAGKFLVDEGMDYILANITILNQLPYKGQFTPFIEMTDEAYGGKNLLRYHSTSP